MNMVYRFGKDSLLSTHLHLFYSGYKDVEVHITLYCCLPGCGFSRSSHHKRAVIMSIRWHEISENKHNKPGD